MSVGVEHEIYHIKENDNKASSLLGSDKISCSESNRLLHQQLNYASFPHSYTSHIINKQQPSPEYICMLIVVRDNSAQKKVIFIELHIMITPFHGAIHSFINLLNVVIFLFSLTIHTCVVWSLLSPFYRILNEWTTIQPENMG